MASSKRRTQLIVWLSGSAVASVLLAGAAVAGQRDTANVEAEPNGYCTLSPKPTVYVAGNPFSVNPGDIVIPC